MDILVLIFSVFPFKRLVILFLPMPVKVLLGDFFILSFDASV